MQEAKHRVEHFEKDRPGDLRAGRGGASSLLVRRRKVGLDELDVPIAELVPDEVVDGIRRPIEPVLLEGAVDFADDRVGSCRIQRSTSVRSPSLYADRGRPHPHLDEPAGVPELVRERPIAVHPLGRQWDVVPRGGQHRHREAHGVGPVPALYLVGIHGVPLRLRHLLPGGVAHEAVDVDLPERDLVHELQAEHHHPRDPEEDDVEPRDQRVVG